MNKHNKLQLLDGFNDAIIGTCIRLNNPPYLIYSHYKCIDILMTNYNINYLEAVEFFEYNIKDLFLGDATPGFIEDWF